MPSVGCAFMTYTGHTQLLLKFTTGCDLLVGMIMGSGGTSHVHIGNILKISNNLTLSCPSFVIIYSLKFLPQTHPFHQCNPKAASAATPRAEVAVPAPFGVHESDCMHTATQLVGDD